MPKKDRLKPTAKHKKALSSIVGIAEDTEAYGKSSDKWLYSKKSSVTDAIEAKDYRDRSYLSAIEAASYLHTSVSGIHNLVRKGIIKAKVAGSGQMRFDLKDLKKLTLTLIVPSKKNPIVDKFIELNINETIQKIFIENSMKLDALESESIHLMITSPPYFNTKMYSKEHISGDLGDIHDIDEWFEKIGEVWKEVFRVLEPGRKAFINIMNLPIRENHGFRTLNLAGKTIDLCEKMGFIFKRDIVWHKTNAVRAHFGTYPYPGGILINNMHEFILEFDKPGEKGFSKYQHLTKEQKEQSRLDKEFWLSIKKSDVWVMKPQGSGDRRNHIAPFPYELPFRLIKAFSYIGETVLDPFVGSGTTLLAATDLKRSGIGYEINPEIAQQALENLKNHQTKLW